MMQETFETLLKETSELLNTLLPVVKRSINALQHDPNPLLQHLIQQEVEGQEDLLQRIEEMKRRLQEHLNPPNEAAQPTQSQYLDLHPDLHADEIAFVRVLADGAPPAGAAVLTPYPLTVSIPEKDLEISCRYGIDTLIEVIKVLGIEKVRKLGLTFNRIPLVAIKEYDGCGQKKVEEYYIAAKSTTFIKARQIDMMGDMLEVRLYVENNTLSVPS